MAWSAAIPINSCTDSMGIAALHPSYSSIIPATGSSCSRASSLLPRATASRGRVQLHVPRTGSHVADRAGTLNVGWRGAQRYPSPTTRAAWASLRSTHPTHPSFQPLPAPVREQARSYEERQQARAVFSCTFPGPGPSLLIAQERSTVGWRGAQRYPSIRAPTAWVSLRSTHPTHPSSEPLAAPVREQARSYEEPIGTDR